MKRFFFFVAVLSLGLLPGTGPVRQSPFPESGTVVRVADGDTVTVRFSDGIERRVRLIGVDAPEMEDGREEVAWRAFLSRRFVFHHLYRRAVRLSYDFDPLDEHGRVLAYVWDARGGLFNELIIRRGFAAPFLKYPFRKDFQKRFRAAGAAARKERLGFWRTDEPGEIPVSEVRDHFGEIVVVRFLCAEALGRGSFLVLRAADSDFEALIPRDRVSLFPGAGSLAGKEVRLTGLAEEFAGRPQIIISFPRQLRLT
ncbi:MAG: thermonuclease family protein [Candidatus Aminicenantes bacterium]|nr:thermonuclease family protein [Candidatus Aminicenantes bacterium]